MYPLTIGLAIENCELMRQTQSCLAALPFRVIVEHPGLSDLNCLLDRLGRMRPEVMLVDISGWKDPLEPLVSSIRSAAGDPMIIALSTTQEAEAILASIRAGFNEYLFPPVEDALRTALERHSAERSRKREKGGKALAFVSAKGGCGATTLVCHVAAALGRMNQRVLLADLDLDAGIVGFITNVKSTYSILDVVAHLDRLDLSYWKAVVSAPIPGVEVLAAPPALAFEQPPRSEEIRKLIAFARSNYDWTLVDLGRGLSHTGMAAMEEAAESCLVVTPEVPALHQAKQIVQRLLDSGYGNDRIRLVVNRMPKNVGFTVAEMERVLGARIFETIPDEYAVLFETYARGCMLDRTSDLGKRITGLAAKLGKMEDEKPTRKPAGLFGFHRI